MTAPSAVPSAEAVEAAMLAIEKRHTAYGISPFDGDDGGRADDYERDMVAVLAAALPHLTAQLRAEIADEIADEIDSLRSAVTAALSHHWQTSIVWGGEVRDACGRCAYTDGVRYLWPCPTRCALTGEAAPDPLPLDPEMRAKVEAKIAGLS